MVRFVVWMLCFAALPTGNAIHGATASRSIRKLQSIGQVDRLVLINADTNLPILDLVNGTVINVATQSTSNFNIQATIVANSGSVGSIVFGYSTKPNVRVENSVPFSFCGDGNPVGNYNACSALTTRVQPHVVSATPYAGTKVNGTKGVTRTVSFRIVNIPSTPAPTTSPSSGPSAAPINTPSNEPSAAPINTPSNEPSAEPSSHPIASPTKLPTQAPTTVPTTAPTMAPTTVPTKAPTMAPTTVPTKAPTKLPTKSPLAVPTCNIPKFIDATWSGISPNYPNTTVEPMGLLIGNDFVSFSGFVNNFSATSNQTYARDITISGSKWRRMDDMPLAASFTHAPLVRIGMKVYMCGGYIGRHPGPHTAYCFIYDHAIAPGTGAQWTRFADLPNGGYAGGGMIYDTMRDALYFAGGGQRLNAGSPHPVDFNRTFKYSFQNPSAGWVEIAPILYKANHLSSVSQTYLGIERHYFVGGQKGEFEVNQNLANVYEFVASNETWVPRTFMPFGRSHTTASTRPIGCGFIVAGGSVNSVTTKKNRTTDILYYDIPTDSWTSIGNLSIVSPHPTPMVDIHSNCYMYYIAPQRSNRRRICTI